MVDNILHLVNQISPGSKQKNDAQDKSKSLLVGDMETDAASAVDASAVVDASAADAEDNNEHDDGHSVASSAQSSLFAARDDSNLAACFEAMDFIPLVQYPYNALGQIEKGTLETLQILVYRSRHISVNCICRIRAKLMNGLKAQLTIILIVTDAALCEMQP